MSGRVVRFGLDEVNRAAEAVSRGAVIVYPTETVYGIGCDPFNEESLRRVCQIKRREGAPMPVLASGLLDLEKVCVLDELSLRLGAEFWPGPVSLVVKRSRPLSSLLTAGKDTLAVRIPCHLMALETIRRCGGLLLGTSANLSGEKPPRSLAEVHEQIVRAVDLCIDGGPSAYGRPSTIVDVHSGELGLLREGPVPFSLILKRIKELNLPVEVDRRNSV